MRILRPNLKLEVQQPCIWGRPYIILTPSSKIFIVQCPSLDRLALRKKFADVADIARGIAESRRPSEGAGDAGVYEVRDAVSRRAHSVAA